MSTPSTNDISTPADRELDLILVGASGFVGKLTAAHLAEHAPADLKIALAGRSGDKLTQVRAGLTGAARDWPIIVVDVTNPAAAADLAARTRVVVTTVGPYLRYGLPLATACAEAGTDYADLTGETLFVRRSIDANHARAIETGARIVHSCGFDSIPSDLGVGLCAAQARKDGEGELVDATLHVRALNGGASGGTIDSLRQQIIETGTDPALRKLAANPYAFVDGPPPVPPSTRKGLRPPARRDEHTGRWSAPFVMGGFNRQIVHRSNALSDFAYGRTLGYREVIDTGTSPAGAAVATGITVGLSALMAGMANGVSRGLLDKVLPKPGEGPSDKARRNGKFVVEVVAETTTGARYLTRVGADHDPGYDGTAVMLGQAGLALVGGEVTEGSAGVTTPMAALGGVLPDRLRTCGFTVATERL